MSRPQTRTTAIPAVILAGGQATRMGGGDKALLPLAGQVMLARVIGRATAQCGALALSANGDAARFADYGLPVLADSVPGHAGPLAGVLAGLDWAAAQGADHIVSLAADTPFFPQDLVARLWSARGAQGLALAATRVGDRVLYQPTFGLWPVDLRDDLRAALNDGVRKVTRWAEQHNPGVAVFGATPQDPFFNINTPADLAQAEALIAGA